MFSFPTVSGSFPVGSTTFVRVLHPHERRTIGCASLKTYGEQALRLEEVAFTAYYPAKVDGSRIGVEWVTRPLKESLRGYARFGELSNVMSVLLWPIMFVLGALLKIPVFRNAPLLDPASVLSRQISLETIKQDCKPWPLVICSHGLGGSRTAYSQLCTRIASGGRVVLALEHRDGTGHMCIDTRGRVRLYIQDGDVVWTDSDEHSATDPLPFRRDQLTFRRHEIYLAHSAFVTLSMRTSTDGEGELRTSNGAPIDWGSWGGMRVCTTTDVGLIGHSFGGATVLSILSNPPPEGHAPIPISKALVLDPWLEPIASPSPSPYECIDRNHHIDSISNHVSSSGSSDTTAHDANNEGRTDSIVNKYPDMLVINSEGFTLWKDHFKRLQGVVGCWDGQLLTLIRSRHMSFSDFPLLPFVPIPGFNKARSHALMDLIVHLGDRFLSGLKRDKLLDGVKERKMEIVDIPGAKEGPRKWARKLVGDVGDVIVHM